MSTLADELLQDFEGSGSEAGGDEADDGFFDAAGVPNGLHENGGDTAMEELRDEDDDEDEDEEMKDSNTVPAPDDDDARAKIEKMQLGGIKDVRSVAVLMKTLTPVLEVSQPLLSPTPSQSMPSAGACVYISLSEP